MSAGLFLFLLALGAQPEACGSGPDELRRRALLLEINAERLGNGVAPLLPHPLLCRLAAERAAEVASRGSTDADVALLDRTTRRLYRGGYTPHNWAANDLLLVSASDVLGQWRQVRRAASREATAGDFEHIGIASTSLAGQPVYSILLAIPKITFERRLAAPLGDLDRVRHEALDAVNAARREHGRPPLRADPRLDRAAQAHADDMRDRGFYNHQSPEGVKVTRRSALAGYTGARIVSENIAKGLFEPAEVVRRWMASSGHRRNILRPGIRDIGLGVAIGETAIEVEVYWVQVLAARR